MSEDGATVKGSRLKAFAKEVFVKLGIPPEDAEISSEVLIWANLRGIDAQGVLRIPWYVQLVDEGLINPKPRIETIKENPSVLFIEADRALGHVVTTRVVERAIQKAKQTGICWCLIRNHAHQAALGYYTLMAAERDMAGIAIVSALTNMVPYGAKTAGLHNSPISIAVPAKNHRPLMLDMATSVVAKGKVYFAVDKGIPIPESWAVDKEGKATTDPSLAEALLPIGGPKGSGLAMMFACLTSTMADNCLLEPLIQDPSRERKHNQNSVIAVIDISNFTDIGRYKCHIDTLIECIKGLPRAEGVDEIFVPGEIEYNCYDQRIKNGIPLPNGTVKSLMKVAEKLDVESPFDQ